MPCSNLHSTTSFDPSCCLSPTWARATGQRGTCLSGFTEAPRASNPGRGPHRLLIHDSFLRGHGMLFTLPPAATSQLAGWWVDLVHRTASARSPGYDARAPRSVNKRMTATNWACILYRSFPAWGSYPWLSTYDELQHTVDELMLPVAVRPPHSGREPGLSGRDS